MERTEKEKMITGELYFSADPELTADRKFAREQMALINQTKDAAVRSQLIKETFGKTAKHVYIEPTLSFDYGYNITVGKEFYANFNNTFLDVCPITIGDNCMFGPNVQLYTATHPLEPAKRNSGLEAGKPITIGNNVWLGGGAIIVPGVRLGDNVVVAAGAVVTKSFGDNVLLGGNPAKVIKQIAVEKVPTDLEQARQTIDAIDKQLVSLLEERLHAVDQVIAYKKAHQQPILDTSRETAVLDKAAGLVTEERFRTTVRATFADIMKNSRAYQETQLEE